MDLFVKTVAGNSYGTPLHYAIPKNNFMVITLILDQLINNCDDKKTYLNAKNSYGGTSLLLAIVKKQFKTARTLIDQGSMTYYNIKTKAVH